ncbi:hypothetical protein ACFV5G_08425 [Streptomyces sp. NPDC059766]|uniref:hypothetical protein n=1 Tax=Streptomyces sp. NPDC059766 TaxID=3346940 RepID=UPI003668A854
MSTPREPSQQPPHDSGAPAQPTAYPYPNPQSPGAGGPGAVPPPSPPAPPAGPPTLYSHPAPAGGPALPPPGNPYAAPGPYGPYPAARPSGTGGAGRALLWAVTGAVAASVLWAAGLFALHGLGAAADLRGYDAPANLCTGSDHSSFSSAYPLADTSPTHSSLRDGAFDQSTCNVDLKKSGSTYADAYLTIDVQLHKKTDPGPEFTAAWKNYPDNHEGYDVDTVAGIGDEAYLVSQDTISGSTSGSLYATLAVRDGWVTYTMTYSAYLTSYSTDSDPPQLAEVTGWLKSDTRSTLEELRG